MTKNKLVLQRDEQEILRIEVNDNGDEIVLDPLDTDFPIRLDDAMAAIEKSADLLQQKFIIIDKQEDKERKGLYSKNEREKMQALQEFNKKNRETIDSLFGKGTSQAVFGDKNYFGMFNDLFRAIAPFVEELYGNTENLIERVKAKYSMDDKEILK